MGLDMVTHMPERLRARKGFIDDTEDLEASDSSSVFCCLALSVVEVWSGVSREILLICRIETSQTGTVTTACDTGLWPSGSSESQGSVSRGEPAPISDDALGGYHR